MRSTPPVSASEVDLHRKWRGETAERYADGRFRSAARARRDPTLVQRCLRRYAIPAGGLVLDVPCGTTRLFDAVATGRRYVGLDVSADMLRAADAPATLLVGDALRLPFADRSVPLVLCCRLLHHLPEIEGVVRELVRVSSGFVLASFWDSASWQARRNARRPRAEPRRARPAAEVRAAFEAAGADVLGFEHNLRFISQQTFAVARVRP